MGKAITCCPTTGSCGRRGQRAMFPETFVAGPHTRNVGRQAQRSIRMTDKQDELLAKHDGRYYAIDKFNTQN